MRLKGQSQPGHRWPRHRRWHERHRAHSHPGNDPRCGRPARPCADAVPRPRLRRARARRGRNRRRDPRRPRRLRDQRRHGRRRPGRPDGPVRSRWPGCAPEGPGGSKTSCRPEASSHSPRRARSPARCRPRSRARFPASPPEISPAPANRSGLHPVTGGRTDVGKPERSRHLGGTRDDGFTAYVAGRRSHLFRTAYLLCGDPHRAEDIVQTALAKLYVAWPRASRADSVDAYVRRVIINSHLDETRRPWRRESPVEQDRLDRATPAGVSPEDPTPCGRRCAHSGRSSVGSWCSGTTGVCRWRRPPPTSASAPAP